MALALAQTLARMKTFEIGEVFRSYEQWLYSQPFDCGNTIYRGLKGSRNHQSQAI